VTRIAVDGIDCAGKTTFADKLGALLHAARLSVDDFLRPAFDIAFEDALERAVVRDADLFDDVRDRYERRYQPGRRLYISAVDPRSRADIVVAA
jgi:predicted kinase